VSAPVVPVVKCVIWDNSGTLEMVSHEIADVIRHSTDMPALAVPDALWHDVDFLRAVSVRAHELAGWDYPTANSFLVAIHAELRARADGAA